MKKYIIILTSLLLLISMSTTYAETVSPLDSVKNKTSGFFNSVNLFRESTFKDVSKNKIETQKRIDFLDSASKSQSVENIDNKKLLDVTEKPIAYIKIILLLIIAFIFSSKGVFYGVCILVLVLILRFIYRKIRRK